MSCHKVSQNATSYMFNGETLTSCLDGKSKLYKIHSLAQIMALDKVLIFFYFIFLFYSQTDFLSAKPGKIVSKTYWISPNKVEPTVQIDTPSSRYILVSARSKATSPGRPPTPQPLTPSMAL